jgi:hypothetical protein
MPWASLKCSKCGREYRHYAVGEVEGWVRRRMEYEINPDRAHFARRVKKLETLCPYCREAYDGMPYGYTWGGCVICGSVGRDKHGNCKGCGGPLGELVSKTFLSPRPPKGKIAWEKAKNK